MTRTRVALAALVAVSLGARGAAGQPAKASDGPAQGSASSAAGSGGAAGSGSGSAAAPTLTAPLSGHVFLHVRSKSHLTTDGGSSVDLPPGYFVDEPGWTALDTSFKSNQDDITRLNAENQSLKTSMSGWQPGWKLLVGAVVLGVVGGWELHAHL